MVTDKQIREINLKAYITNDPDTKTLSGLEPNMFLTISWLTIIMHLKGL